MKETATGRETAGIRRSLFWSATVHLLGGFALLAMGAAPSAAPFRGVVDVFLLRSLGENRGTGGYSAGDPSSLGSSVPGIPVPGPEVSPGALEPPIRPRGEGPGERQSFSGKAVADVPAASAEKVRGGEDPGPTVLSPDSGLPHLTDHPPAEGGADAQQTAGDAPFGGGTNAAGSTGASTTAFDPSRAGEGSGAGMGMAKLRRRIESGIVYPEEAVRRGQQGEVLLRIRIERGGVPSEVRIARSSGVRLLDEAASRGVIRAAPLPSDPGWVEVPIRFQLR